MMYRNAVKHVPVGALTSDDSDLKLPSDSQ